MPVLERTLAAWLPADIDKLRLALVQRALMDIGICEVPIGSNRSGRIDEYNKATGAPIGSYWCASAMTAWWREAGAEVPKSAAASCDTWMAWAKKTKRWKPAHPIPGDAVVYGKPTDANHIGLVVRVTPLLLSVEGNTSIGGEFSRNGVAVDLKEINRSRLLGYISPLPVSV